MPVHGKGFFNALAGRSRVVFSPRCKPGSAASLEAGPGRRLKHPSLGRFERIVDVGGGAGELSRLIDLALPGCVRDPLLTFRTCSRWFCGPPDGVETGVRKFPGRRAGRRGRLRAQVRPARLGRRRAAAILRHCRSAMSDGGRVFAIEVVVPDGAAPSIAKTHDVNMLVLTGGCERTMAKYRACSRARSWTWCTRPARRAASPCSRPARPCGA